MKITYVGQLPPHPGGGAVRDGQLLSSLAERRHDVVGLALVFRDRWGFEPSWLSPQVRTVRLTLPGSGDPFRAPTDAGNLERQQDEVQRRLSFLLRDRRPDVLLALSQPLIDGVPELCRRRGVPCVILQHDVAFVSHYPPALRDRMRAMLHRAALVISCANHVAGLLKDIGLDRVAEFPTASIPTSSDRHLRSRACAVRSTSHPTPQSHCTCPISNPSSGPWIWCRRQPSAPKRSQRWSM